MPVRHSSVTTIAPTGKISRIAGCSSGIEPHYAPAWRSNVLWRNNSPTGTLVDAPDPIRRAILSEMNGDKEKTENALARIADDPLLLSEYSCAADFRSAHDVPPADHVLMQAAWQAHVTNGVSKTVNLPHHATADDISEVYKLAHRHGCKAVCVYRDGSKTDRRLRQRGRENEAFPSING